MSGKRFRFESGEVKHVIGLLGLSAVLHAINPHEIDAVGNVSLRSMSAVCEPWEMTSHAITSSVGRA